MDGNEVVLPQEHVEFADIQSCCFCIEANRVEHYEVKMLVFLHLWALVFTGGVFNSERMQGKFLAQFD